MLGGESDDPLNSTPRPKKRESTKLRRSRRGSSSAGKNSRSFSSGCIAQGSYDVTLASPSTLIGPHESQDTPQSVTFSAAHLRRASRGTPPASPAGAISSGHPLEEACQGTPSRFDATASSASCIAQDPRASARYELTEALRKHHAEGICRALAPAVRLGVPPEELEAALRALTTLVRKCYLREANLESMNERTGEQLSAANLKLNSIAQDVSAVKAKLSVQAAAVDTHGTLMQTTDDEWAVMVADAGRGGSGESTGHAERVPHSKDIAAMSACELRDAIFSEKMRVDAANARLAVLYDEVLRRACSQTE